MGEIEKKKVSGVLLRPFLSFFPYKDTQNQKCPFKSLQGLKPVLFLLNLPQKWDISGIEVLIVLIDCIFFQNFYL